MSSLYDPTAELRQIREQVEPNTRLRTHRDHAVKDLGEQVVTYLEDHRATLVYLEFSRWWVWESRGRRMPMGD